jgi:hypothetical protein
VRGDQDAQRRYCNWNRPQHVPDRADTGTRPRGAPLPREPGPSAVARWKPRRHLITRASRGCSAATAPAAAPASALPREMMCVDSVSFGRGGISQRQVRPALIKGRFNQPGCATAAAGLLNESAASLRVWRGIRLLDPRPSQAGCYFDSALITLHGSKPIAAATSKNSSTSRRLSRPRIWPRMTAAFPAASRQPSESTRPPCAAPPAIRGTFCARGVDGL